MMSRTHVIRGACASVAMFLALASANIDAIPVQMQTVVTLTGSDGLGANISIPGTSFGDAITLTVIVDNGGTSLLSQNWNTATDIVSATLDVGAYTAMYDPPFFSAFFSTGVSGQLTSAFFVYTVGTVTDTFGTSSAGKAFTNAIFDTLGRSSFFDPTQWYNGNLGLWVTPKFAAAPVPEPATLALLSLGLAGLGFSRRKK